MKINIQTAARPRTASELRDAIAEAQYNIALQARWIGNYEAKRTDRYDPGVWGESRAWHDRLNALHNLSVVADSEQRD